MKASYWQRGEALDYVNAAETKIEAGTVLTIGKRIGIAGTDINPGELGSVHVSGVYEFDKADKTEIKMGTEVYFTDAGITASATTPGEEEKPGTDNVPAGYAAADSPADSTKIYVKING